MPGTHDGEGYKFCVSLHAESACRKKRAARERFSLLPRRKETPMWHGNFLIGRNGKRGPACCGTFLAKADYFSDHSLYNNLVANFMSPENEIRLNLLRSAPLDSWIALSNDETRIVAVGKSFVEVSRQVTGLVAMIRSS
jgi:hypothetical protein